MSTTSLKIAHYLKYLALLLVIAGIPTLLLDRSPGSQIPLLVGLFMLLVTRSTVEDERSAQLKTSSLYLAFIISYAVKLLTSNLYSHDLISFEFVEIDQFLIFVLGLANIIFFARLYLTRILN